MAPGGVRLKRLAACVGHAPINTTQRHIDVKDEQPRGLGDGANLANISNVKAQNCEDCAIILKSFFESEKYSKIAT